jgi:hypothetical protein
MRETSSTLAADANGVPGTDSLAIALPFAGIVIRLFVARSSPLPPDNVVLFLLTGVLQDVAAGLLITLLARGLGRVGLPGRAAAAATAVPFVVLLAGHAGWAEAIVYFGHPPAGRTSNSLLAGTSFRDRWTPFRCSGSSAS